MSIEHKARASAIACAAALSLCGLAQAQAPAPATRAANTDLASKPQQSAEERVTAALDVVRQIEAEPRMKQLLQQAKGIFIVPKFGRAALGVGIQSGAGLLLLKHADGSWSSPAEAGLTVVNWSKLAVGTAGAGDVVAWSGTKGLFGDAVAVGLTGIHFNEKLNNAYYGRTLAPKDIANASVSNAQAKPLQQALGRASGHAG
jgi:lipid-binding SYLF domain-containing protein